MVSLATTSEDFLWLRITSFEARFERQFGCCQNTNVGLSRGLILYNNSISREVALIVVQSNSTHLLQK
jgi:hypothetical protein